MICILFTYWSLSVLAAGYTWGLMTSNGECLEDIVIAVMCVALIWPVLVVGAIWEWAKR